MGFASVAVGVATLCALPWFQQAIALFVFFAVAGCTSLPIVFMLLAKRFPQRQSAQALGLTEVSVILAIGIAIPAFSYMYHADATDKFAQAVPFVVGTAAAAIGTVLIQLLDRRPPAPLFSQRPVTSVSDAENAEAGSCERAEIAEI
jgi:MFS family permease